MRRTFQPLGDCPLEGDAETELPGLSSCRPGKAPASGDESELCGCGFFIALAGHKRGQHEALTAFGRSQNPGKNIPQRLKPGHFAGLIGTDKSVPFQNEPLD